MGRIVNIKCNNCHIDNDINIGTGRKYDPDMIGHMAAYCDKCEKYVEVILTKKDNMNLGHALCDECGSPVKVKDIEKDTKCDKCGENLQVSIIGMWD